MARGFSAPPVVNLPDANGKSIQYNYDKAQKAWIDPNGTQVTDPNTIKLITSSNTGNKIKNAANKVTGGINAFTQAINQGAGGRDRGAWGSVADKSYISPGQSKAQPTAQPTATAPNPQFGDRMTIKIGNIEQPVELNGNQWINKSTGKPIVDPAIIQVLNTQKGLV